MEIDKDLIGTFKTLINKKEVEISFKKYRSGLAIIINDKGNMNDLKLIVNNSCIVEETSLSEKNIYRQIRNFVYDIDKESRKIGESESETLLIVNYGGKKVTFIIPKNGFFTPLKIVVKWGSLNNLRRTRDLETVLPELSENLKRNEYRITSQYNSKAFKIEIPLEKFQEKEIKSILDLLI